MEPEFRQTGSITGGYEYEFLVYPEEVIEKEYGDGEVRVTNRRMEVLGREVWSRDDPIEGVKAERHFCDTFKKWYWWIFRVLKKERSDGSGKIPTNDSNA